MTTQGEGTGQSLPFPVAGDRFDQKNEMFKRSVWDEKMLPHGMRFYREVNFRDKEQKSPYLPDSYDFCQSSAILPERNRLLQWKDC